MVLLGRKVVVVDGVAGVVGRGPVKLRGWRRVREEEEEEEEE